MASIAHIIISLLLVAILAKVSEGKINVHHAIIFAFNSYFGPDLFGWLPFYGKGVEIYWFIHGLGWPIIAFAIAIIWFYVNNLIFDWKTKKLTKRLTSDKYYLPYLQIYCLITAAGLFHQFIDIISHPSFVDYPLS